MAANVLSDRISSPSSVCGKFCLPSWLTQTRYARQKGECPGGLQGRAERVLVTSRDGWARALASVMRLDRAPAAGLCPGSGCRVFSSVVPRRVLAGGLLICSISAVVG